jgi:hypothetical protein
VPQLPLQVQQVQAQKDNDPRPLHLLQSSGIGGCSGLLAGVACRGECVAPVRGAGAIALLAAATLAVATHHQPCVRSPTRGAAVANRQRDASCMAFSEGAHWQSVGHWCPCRSRPDALRAWCLRGCLMPPQLRAVWRVLRRRP